MYSSQEKFPTKWEHRKKYIPIFSIPATHSLRLQEKEFKRLDRFIVTVYTISLGNILLYRRKKKILQLPPGDFWLMLIHGLLGLFLKRRVRKQNGIKSPVSTFILSSLSTVYIWKLLRTGGFTYHGNYSFIPRSQNINDVYMSMCTSESVKTKRCIIQAGTLGSLHVGNSIFTLFLLRYVGEVTRVGWREVYNH